MKKKLEAELISIAHRILKLKNKSELAQLQQETLKLYEKISVLRFVEENFSDLKPTIGFAHAEKKVEAVFEQEVSIAVENVLSTDEISTDSVLVEQENNAAETPVEDVVEKVEEIVEPEILEVAEETSHTVEPIEEPAVEQLIQTEITAPEVLFVPEEPIKPKQIKLEDFLSEGHVEPIFVRAEEVHAIEKTVTETNTETQEEIVTKVEVTETKKSYFVVDHLEPRPISLNDSLSKSITIGLNDRIGFEKHLFGGSSEDLNRVLSQLNTFSNLDEAIEFIEDMVKPDYNNWVGKDDYVARFMDLVEKKFA